MTRLFSILSADRTRKLPAGPTITLMGYELSR